MRFDTGMKLQVYSSTSNEMNEKKWREMPIFVDIVRRQSQSMERRKCRMCEMNEEISVYIVVTISNQGSPL